MENTASFGYWVRRQRRALDLTQADLARQVGCAPVTIKKIEQDERRPSRQMAVRLADCLAIPPEERDTFVRCGLGEQSVDTLPLPKQPLAVPEPIASAPVPAFLESTVEELLINKPPHFVARERELAQLDEHLRTVLAGNGRVGFVTGEAGRGKTALLAEFARRAQAAQPDLIVARGNCNAFSGVGDPYLPFRDILGMLTGDVETRWAAGAITQEHAHRLWTLWPQAVEILVSEGPDLIDIFVSGSALVRRASTYLPAEIDWLKALKELVVWQSVELHHLEQRQIFEQYTQVLHSLAARQPLLLMIDDLQWADSASINLLFHLGRRLSGSRILILGAYRLSEVALGRLYGGQEKERLHPLKPVVNEFTRHFGDIRMDLDQITLAEGRTFVDALLDREPNRLGEKFRAAMFQRTKGYPLLTVELLRDMQERGDLIQDEAGRWVEGPALAWDTLPVRVEAVIEQRLGRLETKLRDILAVASVEGEQFTAEVIAQVQKMSKRQLLQVLSNELEQYHRLVQEREMIKIGSQSLSCYQFAHVLFQQYLYNQLSHGERTLLHGEIAQALEELYQDHTAQIAVQLAHHFEAADMPERAMIYLRQAGDQAQRSAALAEAARYYQAALKYWPEADKTKRAELLRKLGECQWVTGHPQDALEAFESCYPLFESLGNREGAGAIQRLMGRMYWELGDRKKSLDYYYRALSILEQEPESIELAWVISSISQMYMLADEYDQAITWGERALTQAERLGAEAVTIHALNNIGVAYLSTSEPERGRAMLEESARRALDLGLPHDACRARLNLGEGLAELGYYEEARATFDELYTYAGRVHASLYAGSALVELAKLDWVAGHWKAALARRQQILEWIDRGQSLAYLEVIASSLFGSMHNDLGQAQTACQILEKMLPKVKSFDELQLTAPHLRQLAQALTALGLESMAANLVQELLYMIDQQPYAARHSTMPLLFTCYWFEDRSAPQMKASLQRLEHAHMQLGNSITAAALSEGGGIVARAEGNSVQAVEQFRQAVTLWQTLHRPYDQARALNSLSRTLIQAGESDEADVTFNQALSLIESLTVQLEEAELKTSFLNSPLIQEMDDTRARLGRIPVDC